MRMRKDILKYGLITSLLVNFTIGGRYIVDTKEYEQKTKINTELIQQFKHKQTLFKQKLLKNTEKMDDLLVKISLLSDELNKDKIENNQLKTDNSKLKTENEKLKKAYENRREVKKQRQLNMVLTYYVADCRGCSGITKTGINVSNTIYYKNMRVIATDPRVIPLHSIVKIQTKNETYIAYAADTGGKIKGQILDVLVSSRSEAFRLGRQNATVTILKEGNDS
jgi:3D (Asp-Asp-Asp) domain-containing protein